MTFASSSPVMPDLIRHPASVCAMVEGSQTPDQVRGDGLRGSLGRIAYSLASLGLITGCASSTDHWRALSANGPLKGWAACMEDKGYSAWSQAGMEAAVALQEGATPYSDSAVLRIAMAVCEPLGGNALVELSSADRKQLNEDTEQYLRSRIAAENQQR